MKNILKLLLIIFSLFIFSNINALTINNDLSNITNNKFKFNESTNFTNYYSKLFLSRIYKNYIEDLTNEFLQNSYEFSDEYYAGMYLDNNDTVYLIVENEIPLKYLEYKYRLIHRNNNVKLKYVKYSYLELTNLYYEIIDKLNNTNYNNFSTLGIDISNNKVELGIEKYNKDEIKYIKENITDSKMLNIVKSNKVHSF